MCCWKDERDLLEVGRRAVVKGPNLAHVQLRFL